MKRFGGVGLATALSGLLGLLAAQWGGAATPAGGAVTAAGSGFAHAWDDPNLPPERRAELLNRELTLDERIGLIHGIMALPVGDKPVPPEAIAAAGYIAGIARLGIPALYESDASLGVANPLRVRPGDGATALPSGLALAATFNPALAYAGGAMIGSEARAKGFNVLLAGGVNLTREPRNGRNFEYLGEDPLLAGTLAGESIRGIQSNHIISTTKHYALNEQETARHMVNEVIDEAPLRESDLLAFELAIEGGHPGSVMCAYNKVNGDYACGNDFLLNRVLKRDWGFPGWVMSDWGAVYGAYFALHGLDQESGEQLDQQVWFDAPLREAVKERLLPAARLQDMTRRILYSMFADGLFDYPLRKSDIDYPAHAEVARQEANEAIVLLRNQGNILPLKPDPKRILVVGGRADLGTLSGGGSSQVFAPNANPRSVIPLGGAGEESAWRNMVYQSSAPLAALRARAPQAATVVFNDGRYPLAAAALAKQADLVIVFAGQWTMEDEDVPDLSLPSGQDELIQALAAVNPHTIVVLETGGPVFMPWLEQTAAVLEAWYPGAGGADAIADVIFGMVNPSGRLPITFPASTDQLAAPLVPGFGVPPGERFEVAHPHGADVGYRWTITHQVKSLFPFGFGLSYGQFKYSKLEVQGGESLTVSFDVTNDGAFPGKDAPQVYLTSIAGQKVRRLLGFSKVEVKRGETEHVSVRVEPRLLAHFDPARHQWHVKAGTYEVGVGADAASVGLTQAVRMEESWRKP